MADIGIRQILIKDPLNDATRKERRSLLAAATIGLVIVKGGFLPSKISALGIEFSEADKSILLIILGIIIGYFLLAFIVYATSDFLYWLLSYQIAITKGDRDNNNRMFVSVRQHIENTKSNAIPHQADNVIDEATISKRGKTLSRYSMPLSLIRVIFDLFLPIIIGIYAILCLFY